MCPQAHPIQFYSNATSQEFSSVLHTCGAELIATLRWSQCSLTNEQAAI